MTLSQSQPTHNQQPQQVNQGNQIQPKQQQTQQELIKENTTLEEIFVMLTALQPQQLQQLLRSQNPQTITQLQTQLVFYEQENKRLRDENNKLKSELSTVTNYSQCKKEMETKLKELSYKQNIQKQLTEQYEKKNYHYRSLERYEYELLQLSLKMEEKDVKLNRKTENSTSERKQSIYAENDA